MKQFAAAIWNLPRESRDRIRLLDATKSERQIAREIRAALRSHAIFKGIGV